MQQTTACQGARTGWARATGPTLAHPGRVCGDVARVVRVQNGYLRWVAAYADAPGAGNARGGASGTTQALALVLNRSIMPGNARQRCRGGCLSSWLKLASVGYYYSVQIVSIIVKRPRYVKARQPPVAWGVLLIGMGQSTACRRFAVGARRGQACQAEPRGGGWFWRRRAVQGAAFCLPRQRCCALRRRGVRHHGGGGLF